MIYIYIRLLSDKYDRIVEQNPPFFIATLHIYIHYILYLRIRVINSARVQKHLKKLAFFPSSSLHYKIGLEENSSKKMKRL